MSVPTPVRADLLRTLAQRGAADMTRTAALLLRGFGFRLRIDPKFYSDVGELLGISEPAVAHHRPQRGQAGRHGDFDTPSSPHTQSAVRLIISAKLSPGALYGSIVPLPPGCEHHPLPAAEIALSL
jgi:hypothetical protein